ncbi:unnamed protein product [Caenorhabditis angaria]|uniref:Uncharacterized protein n=1 Tax=Caenorhabditis angaria TaxID=860376 RepID=A0A9P1MYU7_9PELO|nr:unnamed protein product [Caenorhabditis angaria]
MLPTCQLLTSSLILSTLFSVSRTRPVVSIPINLNSTSIDILPKNSNSTLLQDILWGKDKKKMVDTSTYITLRENDWRDAHEGRMIIWSLESQYHPDYGKTYSKGRKINYEQRHTKSSQLMSFCILGSVIGFILYTYFSHVLMVRRLDRELEATRLRELVQRSALIMAGSVQQQNEIDLTERRRSLINMFKAFKL